MLILPLIFAIDFLHFRCWAFFVSLRCLRLFLLFFLRFRYALIGRYAITLMPLVVIEVLMFFAIRHIIFCCYAYACRDATIYARISPTTAFRRHATPLLLFSLRYDFRYFRRAMFSLFLIDWWYFRCFRCCHATLMLPCCRRHHTFSCWCCHFFFSLDAFHAFLSFSFDALRCRYAVRVDAADTLLFAFADYTPFSPPPPLMSFDTDIETPSRILFITDHHHRYGLIFWYTLCAMPLCCCHAMLSLSLLPHYDTPVANIQCCHYTLMIVWLFSFSPLPLRHAICRRFDFRCFAIDFTLMPFLRRCHMIFRRLSLVVVRFAAYNISSFLSLFMLPDAVDVFFSHSLILRHYAIYAIFHIVDYYITPNTYAADAIRYVISSPCWLLLRFRFFAIIFRHIVRLPLMLLAMPPHAADDFLRR